MVTRKAGTIQEIILILPVTHRRDEGRVVSANHAVACAGIRAY